MINKNNLTRFWLILALLLSGLFLAACTSAGDDHSHDEDDHSHSDDDHSHDDGEAHDRIPNQNGAAITITSPADGETFGTLDQIIVEISTENFELGENGNHWHVYVDDDSYGMVMGQNSDHALPGLEPGEYKISVFMSIDSHEEYEEGDSVMIVVEE